MSTGFRRSLRSLALLLALAAPVAAQTVTIGNGAAATPSLRFVGSPTTGLFRKGADTLGFAAGGNVTLWLQQTGGTATLGTGNFLSLRSGGTMSFFIGATQAAQVASGGLMPGADNTFDMGTSINQWRHLFSSGRITASTVRTSTAGSATQPAIAFATSGADTSTGIYIGSGFMMNTFRGSIMTSLSTNAFQMESEKPFRLSSGTAAAPSLGFVNSTTTGLYRFGADTIGFTNGGAITARLQSTGLMFPNTGTSCANAQVRGAGANSGIGMNSGAAYTYLCADNLEAVRVQAVSSVGYMRSMYDGTAALPFYSWNGDSDLGIYRAGTNRLGFSTGGVARWEINASGHLVAGIDNQVDVGDDVTGPRDIYARGVFRGTVGSAAAPHYTYSSDLNTGMYRVGEDTLGFATGASRTFMMSGGTTAILTGSTVGDMYIRAGTGTSQGVNIEANNGGGTNSTVCTFSVVAVQHLRCPSRLIGMGDGTASAPSYTFTSDPDIGSYRLGADTLAWSIGGNGIGMVNSNGLEPVSNGSKNLGSNTRAWNVAFVNAFKSVSTSGAASATNYQIVSSGRGLYSPHADTIGFALNDAALWRWTNSGGTTSKVIGSAGNMTIQAGTGNSRTMTLQATSSVGAAQDNLVLNADGSVTVPASAATTPTYGLTVGSGGTGATQQRIRINGGSGSVGGATVYFDLNGTNKSWLGVGDATPLNDFKIFSSDTIRIGAVNNWRMKVADMPATGAGDVALCWHSTSLIVKQGATCGSSSALVKLNITSLGETATKTMALRPVSYNYIPGFYNGRAEYGLIADEVAKVDSTLVFFADRDETLPNGKVLKKGDPLNVNDRAVMALLLAEIQNLRKEVEALKAAQPKH